jgi:hypothetical protein
MPDDYTRWQELASMPEANEWLAGIVYGPGMVVNLPTFANSTFPNRFPVRLYPDITHSLGDQLPVPHWDPAIATTEEREPVNPRPTQHTKIAVTQKVYTEGGGISTYNEGCHDDVNKIVWAAIYWGCDGGSEDACDVDELVKANLMEYARVHFGSDLEEAVVEGIYSLERDWIGPLATNPSVSMTYDSMSET